MSMTFDLRGFTKGIDAVLDSTKKKLPDVLNKAGLTAIIGSGSVQGAIQRTPRATFAGMTRDKVAMHVAHRNRLQGIKMSRGEFSAEVTKEMARRRRAKGYTAGPGWSNAAKALGGRGVRTNERFPKSYAAKGGGTKASVEKLIATIENAAPAAVKIGGPALQAALDATGADMEQYAARKIQEAFDRHQG